MRAIDFAGNAFRSLTYLNGGALVAIPAAVALFGADPKQAKETLITAALLFVAGLILVLVAQACAFFTMARRSEAEKHLEHEQVVHLGMTHYPGSATEQADAAKAAQEDRRKANEKVENSNWWRARGLLFFWLSLGAFLAGCYFGARAVLT